MQESRTRHDQGEPSTCDLAAEVRLRQVPGEVLAEVFDGELVAVQLRTGAYFAFDEAATRLWERLCAGGPLAAVGVEDLELARWLLAERLLEVVGGEPLEGTGVEPSTAGGDAELPRGVSKFTDLADLLVLDPIHDIDLDGDGWPIVRGGEVAAP